MIPHKYISLATPEDYDTIFNLLTNLYSHYDGVNLESVKNHFTPLLDDPDHSWFVYKTKNDVQGILSLSYIPVKDSSYDIASIDELIVDPNHRDKHIGHDLVGVAKYVANRNDVDKLIVGSDIKYDVRQFYESCGFDYLGVKAAKNNDYYSFEIIF